MKPDWKDAPEWANWLAMDACGKWGWYEKEPLKHGYIWIDEGGRYLMIEHPDQWTETKEAKPQ